MDTTTAQNSAEQAPATAPEVDKPDTGDRPEKQGKHRFERRISRLVREAAEAKARAEFYEKQYNETLARGKPAQDDPGAPKLEQFSDIEEYAKAKAKYESDKTLKDHESKQQTEAQKQRQARLIESWSDKVELAGEKYEDFDEVVGDVQPHSAWAAAMMKAPNGVDIAYHLGKNIKEARRISELEPMDQILEIGLLSAKLAAEPSKPKTPSRAPAPITPLTGAAPVVSDVPSEQDDMGAWLKKRSKQVHGNRFGSR